MKDPDHAIRVRRTRGGGAARLAGRAPGAGRSWAAPRFSRGEMVSRNE
jgi:hypothetical protein